MNSRLTGAALRISAYVGENEIYDEKPLWKALLEQSRIQGCAGATAQRGLEGYGSASRDVAKHALRMSQDRPIVVSVIDENVRITALAEVWDAMVDNGLITIEDVTVIAYRGSEDPSNR